MFVGETGISRVVQRTCEAMKAAGISDPNDIAKVRALGVVDLPTIQKKLHSALFAVAGSVRFGSLHQRRERLQCRHQGPLPRDRRSTTITACRTRTYPVLKLVDGKIQRVDEPALTALNMRLRDDYTQDCVKGLLRWNKIIALAGYDYQAGRCPMSRSTARSANSGISTPRRTAC